MARKYIAHKGGLDTGGASVRAGMQLPARFGACAGLPFALATRTSALWPPEKAECLHAFRLSLPCASSFFTVITIGEIVHESC